jgi:hypothetical protein
LGDAKLASAADGSKGLFAVAAAKPPDDLIATIIDPQGRTIWLTQERWDHILGGHPELARHLGVLKKWLDRADNRTRGNYPDIEKHWARNIGPAKWFTVVVRYEGRIGTVRTAIGVTKGPRQGDLI